MTALDHRARRNCRRVLLGAFMALTAAFLTACAPVVRSGVPLALSPDLVSEGRIVSLTLSSTWLRTDSDFARTLTEEVIEELKHCATGLRPLHLRVHVERLRLADRIDNLVSGRGVHQLHGRAEFVDTADGGRIVGRYPIDIAVNAGGRAVGLVSDREMMIAEGVGRALCQAAFGRNPRPPEPFNATP